jgi:hypothetical protein
MKRMIVQKGYLMGNERKVISYQEFSTHPTEVFELVLDGAEIVVKRGEGETITLMPGALPDDDAALQKKIEAILAAAGSWSDVDTDELLIELRANRNISTRPPVDL